MCIYVLRIGGQQYVLCKLAQRLQKKLCNIQKVPDWNILQHALWEIL